MHLIVCNRMHQKDNFDTNDLAFISWWVQFGAADGQHPFAGHNKLHLRLKNINEGW